MNAHAMAVIGVLNASDRASVVIYNDENGPSIEQYLREVLTSPWRAILRVVPDGIESVRDGLSDLADREKCGLISSTGGTGPARATSRLKRQWPLARNCCRASAN